MVGLKCKQKEDGMGYKGLILINGRLNVWSGGSSGSFVERIAFAYYTGLETHLEMAKAIVFVTVSDEQKDKRKFRTG